MTAIYKIENLINGKVYIGQSIDVEHRWYRHRTDYKNKNRKSEYRKPLYRSFRKYDIENFSFEVLQECEKSSLNRLEIFYINQYCSNHNSSGYNINLDGSQSTFVKLNNEILNEIIDDLRGNLLKSEIAKKFGITTQYLNLLNKGKVLKKDDVNYPIRNEPDTKFFKKEKVECISCGILTKNSKFCSKVCSSNHQRKVDRPSKESLLELLKESTYVDVAKQFNVSDNCIRKWIK